MNNMMDSKLISEIEELKAQFDSTTNKIIKDIKRHDKIMLRSDKRQQVEYDQLQEKLTEVEALKDEIEATQKEVIYTIGAIVETRSKETGNHVKRVAEYSKLFAVEYGLSNEETELIKQASPMHDVGKIGTPDAVLNKPGRLDANEREVMETHARIGYEMLKHSDRKLLKVASIIAFEHHEKWDGTGYPRQLKGEDISIYGRITAIADVYDALGSRRCYKEAWPDQKIYRLLEEEKGKHFDPALVDIFFNNLDKFLEIREKYEDAY